MPKDMIVRRKHLTYGKKGLPASSVCLDDIKDQARVKRAGTVTFQDEDGQVYVLKTGKSAQQATECDNG